MVKNTVISPVGKFCRYYSVQLFLSAPLTTCLATPRSQHLQRHRDTGPSSPPRANAGEEWQSLLARTQGRLQAGKNVAYGESPSQTRPCESRVGEGVE